jgi:hypothetical protein
VRVAERAIHVLAAAGGCATLAFMVHAGRPSGAGWWIGALPFLAWGLAPFAALSLGARALRASRRALGALLAGAAIVAAATAFALVDAFVVHPDAQSGVAFLFLPVWQLLGLAPFLAAGGALRARDRGASPGRAAEGPAGGSAGAGSRE